MNRVLSIAVMALILCGTFIGPRDVQAAMVTLTPYNFNAPEVKIGVDVTVDSSQAFLTITNNSSGISSSSSVTEVYFSKDWESTLSNGSIHDQSSGVNFTTATLTPPDPPGKNIIGWSGTFFGAEAVSSSSGTNGTNPNGIDTGGEFLQLAFSLIGGAYDANGIAGLITPSNLAVKVQDCIGSDSCGAAAVPIPGAIWLMSSALVGIGAFIRRGKLRYTSAV